MSSRFVAVVAAVLSFSCAVPAAVSADQPEAQPTPVVLPTLPPNVQVNPYVQAGLNLVTGILQRQQLRNDGNRADGQVTYFRRFDLQVRTGANAFRNVHLHPGTEIDPRGESIRPGDHVAVGGTVQSDGSLDADVITIVR